MKKMFAKLGMPSILSLVFLLSGLFFGAVNASAQSTTNNPQGVQLIKTNGTWKSAPDAVSALQQEITYLEQVLSTPTPPANYAELKMRLTIYTEIMVAIGDGQPVGNSAYNAYNKYAPISGVDSHPVTPGVSQSTWLNIYTDMVNLLLL